MINTIVFDMGGVVMDYDPSAYVKRYPELSEEDQQYLEDNIFNDPGWAGLDHGDYDSPEYVEIVKKRTTPRLHKYVEELIMHWHEPAMPFSGTMDVVKELKDRGYKIYLLSNASFNHDIYWPLFPGSEYFDGKVVSAFEHCCKPDEKIYRVLFERFNLKPEECIFIDNLEENIKAGQKLGMDGIVFTDAASLREELVQRNLL